MVNEEPNHDQPLNNLVSPTPIFQQGIIKNSGLQEVIEDEDMQLDV